MEYFMTKEDCTNKNRMRDTIIVILAMSVILFGASELAYYVQRDSFVPEWTSFAVLFFLTALSCAYLIYDRQTVFANAFHVFLIPVLLLISSILLFVAGDTFGQVCYLMSGVLFAKYISRHFGLFIVLDLVFLTEMVHGYSLAFALFHLVLGMLLCMLLPYVKTIAHGVYLMVIEVAIGMALYFTLQLVPQIDSSEIRIFPMLLSFLFLTAICGLFSLFYHEKKETVSIDVHALLTACEENAEANSMKKSEPIESTNNVTMKCDKLEETIEETQNLKEKERIAEIEKVAKEKIAKAEQLAKERVVAAEKAAKEKIAKAEKVAEERVATAEKIAQEKIVEAEKFAEEITTEVEKQAQEKITNIEKLAEERVAEAERRAEERIVIAERTAEEKIAVLKEIEEQKIAETAKYAEEQRLAQEKEVAKKKEEEMYQQQLLNIINEQAPLLVRAKKENEKLFLHLQEVATLCFDAANAISANASLAMAGGYYHEIGKLQSKEARSVSSMVYVEEGIALAQEQQFPEQVKSLIREHNVKYELPQSPEAAVVMLTDTIITTLHFLEASAPGKVKMDKIISHSMHLRLTKGDLNVSGLTMQQYRDLYQFYIRYFAAKK